MKGMWKRFCKVADDAAYWVGDRVSDLTGLVALPVPIEQAQGPREVTLDLPGYIQTNSYSCGAMAAAMVVRRFRPRMGFGRIYDAVGPLPEWGAGTLRVVRALRSCGLRVSHRRKLSFARLCRAIDRGRPVVVLIHNQGSEDDHWVVVYGYGRRPDRLFIAVNGVPWFNRNRIARSQFERIWKPPGNGLVCWKK
jgi:hypothetical protein